MTSDEFGDSRGNEIRARAVTIDLGPWSTADFEPMSWHDAHVHGFRFDNFVPGHGTADLVLDIDYILSWAKSDDRSLFTVCQAVLRFHQVFGFQMTLDYQTISAGMAPFAIDGIEREPVHFPNGHVSWRWRLPINWPDGLFEFQAAGFTQTLVGRPQVQSTQSLTPPQRQQPPWA